MDHYHFFSWHFIELKSLLLLLSIFAIVIFMLALFLCAHFCRRHFSPRSTVAAAGVLTHPLPHEWVGLNYYTAQHNMHPSSITSNNKSLGLVGEVFESKECCICLSPFQENEKLKVLRKCRHVFHSECLDMWLSVQLSCPICRTTLQAGNVEVE